jgi:hypothetical protein
MKSAKTTRWLLIIALFVSWGRPLMGADLESHEFFDRLLGISEPGPEIFDDAVIFTAPSSHRRVGVAFAEEGFATVHWMRKLMVTQDPLNAPIPPGKKAPDPYKDSGLLFYVYQTPEGLGEVEYRLIVDGLWTTDPSNPRSRRNDATGISYSLVVMPQVKREPVLHERPKGTLNFSFKGPPGETVTVAGSFNGWDPFMYELREYPSGLYTLTLPLPPGTYQYLFFHRGERLLDPYNFRRAYTLEGNLASEVVIE